MTDYARIARDLAWTAVAIVLIIVLFRADEFVRTATHTADILTSHIATEGQAIQIAATGLQTDTHDALERNNRMEKVISAPFDDMHKFMLGREQFQGNGLTDLNRTIIAVSSQFGDAGARIGNLADKLTAKDGPIDHLDADIVKIGQTADSAQELMDKDHLGGVFKNTQSMTGHFDHIADYADKQVTDPKTGKVSKGRVAWNILKLALGAGSQSRILFSGR